MEDKELKNDDNFYLTLYDKQRFSLDEILHWDLLVFDNGIVIIWEVKQDKSTVKECIPVRRSDNTWNRSADEKYILFRGNFGILYLKVNEYIIKLKSLFKKYTKEIEGNEKKYIKPYTKISQEHKRIIEEKKEYDRVIDRYVEGEMMGKMKKDDLKEDIDPFLGQFDFKFKGKRTNYIYRTIMGMLEDLPRYNKSMILWRGISFENNDFKVGGIIEQKLPFSSSLVPYVSVDFIRENCCLFKLFVPRGYPAIFINKLVEWEEEVILHPAVLKIKKIDTIEYKNLNKFLGDSPYPRFKQAFTDKKDRKLHIIECSVKRFL